MCKLLGSYCAAVAAAVLTVVMATSAVAQQTNPAARPDDRTADPRATGAAATPDRGAPGGQAGMTDKIVADQLLEMSKGEVELANFAMRRTQNEEVRRFAQQMIQDHTNFNNQLAKFASPELARDIGNQPGTPGTEPGTPGNPPRTTTAPPGTRESTAPGQTGPAAGAPGRASEPARPGEPGGATPAPGRPEAATTAGGDPSVQICEDIGKQIGQSIQKELSQYQGSDFDRAYVGQQFWGHVVFVASAKGAEKHVSQDLQQVLNQGSQTAEKHLEHCRTLIRELSANVARGTNPNETTPRR